MFRLIRFIVSCVLLSVFIWFAVTVPLGKRTLFEHVMRIARTEEARDLVKGTEGTAREAAHRVREELHK